MIVLGRDAQVADTPVEYWDTDERRPELHQSDLPTSRQYGLTIARFLSSDRWMIHRMMYCPVMKLLTHVSVLARFGHALSDPTRVRLLLALRESPGYPAELAELLEVSRQSLSNHLGCLRGCGLVVAVPEGRRTRYELADARLGHALTDLLGVVLAVDPAHCEAAVSEECC